MANRFSITKDGKREKQFSDIFSRFLRNKYVDTTLENNPILVPAIYTIKYNGGYSLFRTNELLKTTITEMCLNFVCGKDKVKFDAYFGYGNLTLSDYREFKLEPEIDERNSPRHYNIFGLPLKDNTAIAKEFSQAHFLASRTKVYQF